MKKILCLFLVCMSSGLLARTAFAVGLDDGPNTIFDQTETQDKLKQEEAEECPEDVARGCGCLRNIESFNISALNNYSCVTTKQACTKNEVTQDVSYSCCVCDVKNKEGKISQVPVANQGHTYTTCSATCKKLGEGFDINRQYGAGLYFSTAGPSLAQKQFQNAMCFTPTECAKPEYGGSPSAFRAGLGCPKGKGKCVAPEPSIALSSPIGEITSVQGYRGYIAAVYTFLIGAALIATSIMFVYGGFLYIVGSAFSDIGKAKEIMLDAAIGLILTLGAMTILKTINPQTLRLNALEVYMVNKQQILDSRFCADVKSDQPLKFAEAGAAPLYTPLEKASYTLTKNQTRCNEEYYTEGFQDYRCLGKVCEGNNAVCAPCASGVCPKGANRNAYTCIKATWAGEITYEGGRYVDHIDPILICNNGVLKSATPSGDEIEKAKDAMFRARVENKLDGAKGTEGAGTQTYRFLMSEKIVQDSEAACAPHGGIAGFLLAVQYHDGGGTDDFLIADKTTCNSGGDFGGYSDGRVFAGDESDIRRAITCGMLEPVGNGAFTKTERFWTIDEVKKALAEDQIIDCRLTLNNTNAPSDPSKGKHKVNGCVGDEIKLVK